MQDTNTEVALNRAETVEALSTDLNFFAQVCLPEIYEFEFPAIHKAVWQLLTNAATQEEGLEKLAFGIPRGHAKTILLKLFATYLILFTSRKFILVTCNTQGLSENFLKDVFDILSSQNIQNLFGDYRPFLGQDTLDQKTMEWRGRAITVKGIGSGSSIRGVNVAYVRPDVIICDDMQSREQAESATMASQIIIWFLGTLLKLRSPKRCLVVFVGNMYPFEGSILKKLKHDRTWKSFVTAAILEDGQSIWPALRSVESLLEELDSDTALGHPEIFWSEVMNSEEVGISTLLDITKVQLLDERPAFYESAFIVIDPSLGKKTSDDLVITAVLVYEGVPVVEEILIDKWNPQEMAQAAIMLALKWQIPLIITEGVAYQATASFWIQKEAEALGITEGLICLPILPKGTKNSRIIASFKNVMSGKIKFSHKARAPWINQGLMFNPAKTTNKDDILDTVAYIDPILQDPQFIGAMQRPLAALLEENTIEASSTSTLRLAF